MKKIIYTLLLFLLILIVISTLGLDLRISDLLFSVADKKWTYSSFPLWGYLYKYGLFVPNLIGAISILVFILSFFMNRFSTFRRKTLIAAIVFILGPGLIVQTLKVTWGRPRPIEVTNYGGNFEFKTPFQPNFTLMGDTNNGNSFPSGHAATAYYAMALYFLFKKRWLLPVTFLYGSLMGAARMVQGGHFLSDVVSSFFIVYICMELFKFLILKKQK